MQQRQSTASVGTRSRKQGQQADRADIFLTPSRGAKAENVNLASALEGNTEDAPYFQRRLQRNKQRRTGSQVNTLQTQKRSLDLENQNTHAHLDRFLRDQILS